MLAGFDRALEDGSILFEADIENKDRAIIKTNRKKRRVLRMEVKAHNTSFGSE